MRALVSLGFAAVLLLIGAASATGLGSDGVAGQASCAALDGCPIAVDALAPPSLLPCIEVNPNAVPPITISPDCSAG